MGFDVQQTEEFETWLDSLRDRQARSRISGLAVKLQSGLFGDCKSVGGGVSEFRLDFGPGYRVYFTRRGTTVIILLCGGDKSTQQKDIRIAQALAAGL